MDTATKTSMDSANTTSKRVFQKVAEATVDLIGNKISEKITSAARSKSNKNDYYIKDPKYVRRH